MKQKHEGIRVFPTIDQFERLEAQRDTLRTQQARLVAALQEVTAGCAVIANHLKALPSGMTETDHRLTTRSFALECFQYGRAVLAELERGTP